MLRHKLREDPNRQPKLFGMIDWTALSCPAAADGVALMEDAGGRFFGLDAQTGEILWGPVHGNFGKIGRAPLVWNHDGRSYFILFNQALDPKTGKVLWEQREARHLMAIEGDVAVDTLGAGWTLSLSGAEPAYPWSKEQQQKYNWDFKTPTILDGVAYGEPARGSCTLCRLQQEADRASGHRSRHRPGIDQLL